MDKYGGLKIYLPLCEQYNALAQRFYNNYKSIEKNYGSEPSCDFFEFPEKALSKESMYGKMEAFALCTIIFAALSIEAYVNFWGAYSLGDDKFYSEYEPTKIPGKKQKFRNTIDKMKDICKSEFNSPYPTDTVHFSRLIGLFDKRDRLVHSKPKAYSISVKPFDYNEPLSAYNDYIKATEEINFIYKNLDDEIELYSEVKRNLEICSGKSEPIAQQENDLNEEIKNQLREMRDIARLE